MKRALKNPKTNKTIVISDILPLSGVYQYPYAFKVNDTLIPCWLDKRNAEKQYHQTINRYYAFGYVEE